MANIFYTTKTLADLLGSSATTIRKEIERGNLRCFYVGNEARFTQQHVDEYTKVAEFGKTTRELELEAEIERLLEVIKEKEEIFDNIRDILKKA